MRRLLYEVLAIALLLGSLVFFREALRFLAERDYAASTLVLVMGACVIAAGRALARLALLQRD